MTPKVTALSERLVAELTVEGSLPSVLAEVVPQIAALLEDTLAVEVLAAEIKFDALAFLIFDLNGLVPLARDTLERFARLDSRDFHVLLVSLTEG